MQDYQGQEPSLLPQTVTLRYLVLVLNAFCYWMHSPRYQGPLVWSQLSTALSALTSLKALKTQNNTEC